MRHYFIDDAPDLLYRRRKDSAAVAETVTPKVFEFAKSASQQLVTQIEFPMQKSARENPALTWERWKRTWQPQSRFYTIVMRDTHWETNQFT